MEFTPIACSALRRGTLHRPAGEAIDVLCEHLDLDDGPVPDSICLPLIAQRETFGLLYFEPRTSAATDIVAEVYLEMLAGNIGLALSNLRLRDALRTAAMTDPLTGLANRRQLESAIEHEFAQADRLGQPISCLMIDVDHFKRFNDEHGHDAGDAVLRTVGEQLRAATREAGLAFRYGGEEFLLLLPAADAEGAIARAEQIRSAISDHKIEHHGQVPGSLTVSIGVATTPDHCPQDRLVLAADSALLRAKSQGRDRVTSAQSREKRSVA